ncbi:MAG: hypothetical protein KZQ77_01880 [Candidatus Thiodiazotropha sp. (ex Notomyrtea botanica)]|nr:hypothetical protein [Candidatus Thiodiazotropha sp. (ex Notomyrtea botanica)]
MSSPRAIAVDTNLLVLLIVGYTDVKQISKHKRTKEFEEADFNLLVEILSDYEEILLTPHVLTEVSNLASQIGEPLKSAVRHTLKMLIDSEPEHYEESAKIGENALFARLGLTDCGLLSLVADKVPLITVDLDLYLAACEKSSLVTNFNHLRHQRLLHA